LEAYHVIGLMSGTSLDGLDIAYCKFVKQKRWSFEIVHFKTVPYDALFKERLRNAPGLSSDLLDDLSLDFGVLMAQEVRQFLEENKVRQLDLIASHGHTVFHEPQKGITLQIGSPKPLFEASKTPVVYDFRSQDVAMGGQGAPLVPLVDKMLFLSHDACLNLGGFSNVSFDVKGKRRAFDVCPVNIVLNLLCAPLGLEYDDKGKLASQGELNENLFHQLNGLDYYKKSFPKSLAWEWVGENILPLLKSSGLSVKSQMRTFVEHIAYQMSSVVRCHQMKSVVLSGGGAHHDFLLERLDHYAPGCWVKSTPLLVEAKEAMAFAFLGLLKYQGQVNVLSSVTGCSEDHSSGKMYSDSSEEG